MRKLTLTLFFCMATCWGFAQVDVEKGLIVHYPMNGTLRDTSQQQYHGQSHHVVYEPGERCTEGAYYFNGDDAYIDCGAGEVFNNRFGGLTVSAMIRYTDNKATDNFRFICGKWAFDPKKDQFALMLSKNNKICFAVADGFDIGYGVYGHRPLQPDTWYHVVAIWNRSRKVGIFVNGELDHAGQQNGDGYNDQSDVSFKIGRQVIGQDRSFEGYIDDVRVYGRSLGMEEIKALYKQEEIACNQFTLKGHMLNAKTEEPLPGHLHFDDLDSDQSFLDVEADSATGYYEVNLPIGYHYGISATYPNFISINENIETENIKQNAVIEQDIRLVPIEIGGTVRLNNLFFETAKSTIQKSSYHELDRLVRLFEDMPDLKIEVAGHTDSRGSESYNMSLSKDRANAVKGYLLEQSIDSAKVEAKGYGETTPVATNDTEEGRQQNRRVEFKILEY